MNGLLHGPAVLLLERAQITTKHEVGWAPELIWTLWIRDKSLVPPRNQAPAIQPIAQYYTDCAILISNN